HDAVARVQAPDDRHQLLGRLPEAENHLREAAPERTLVIQRGELEPLERRLGDPPRGPPRRDAPRSHLPQERGELSRPHASTRPGPRFPPPAPPTVRPTLPGRRAAGRPSPPPSACGSSARGPARCWAG